MHRVNKILIFAVIAVCGSAIFLLWNLNQRIPQEEIVQYFESKSFSSEEIDLIDKFSHSLLSNEKDRAVTLVANNKFKFLCLFDHLLQRGVYYSYLNKHDSTAFTSGIAYEIAEIFSNNFEDNFFLKQYEFIQSLRGKRIYQKLIVDLNYYYGKECCLGEGDSSNLAKRYFERSIRLCRKIGDEKWEVDNLVQLQFLLYDYGFHYEALESGYEALKFARKIGYRYREGWAHYGISTTQIDINQYSQALENATMGLAIAKELNDQCGIISNLERITVANRRLGNFKKALEANNESLRYSKSANNQSDQIKNYINFGTIYCNMGNYAKSKDYFETALNLAHQHKDYNESTALENLGELYRILGDFEQALNYNFKALEINLGSGNDYCMAGTKKYIGDVYKDQEDYSAALKYYKEAIQLLKLRNEEAVPLRLAAEIWLCIGDVQQLSDKWDDALESYFQALEAFEKVRNPEGIIKSKTQIGNLFRGINEFQQAFRYLRDAIMLGKDHQDPMLLSYAYYGFGLVSRDIEDLDSAIDSYSKAIQEIEKIRRRIYYEQDKIKYFARVQQLYEDMIIAQYQNANDHAAFDYSERCRARALYDRNSGATDVFSVQTSSTSNDGETDDFEFPPSIFEIQAKLENNIQLIEYKVTDNKVLIFVLDKNNSFVRKSEIRREVLDSLVFSFRKAIGAESDREFRKRIRENSKIVYEQSIVLAKKLYKYLISPVESLLDKEKILYIVPDELLFFLPFAALVSEENGEPRYLIEDFDIAYTPSAAILIHNFEQRKPKIPFDKFSLLAVGNPVGDLAGSEEEVHKIAGLFGNTTLLLRSEATKAKFLEIAKNSFHIIHLATHAVINEKNPLYSYFVLGGDIENNRSDTASTRDGSLTKNDDNVLMAYEIFNIDLSKTRLVALSACETGCGKIFRGEGVIGLSRAFMNGGASSIISTLWKIDDQCSMKITETFYREWKNQSLTKARALRIAQLSLIDEIKRDSKIAYPHPYIWAGFTMLGDYK